MLYTSSASWQDMHHAHMMRAGGLHAHAAPAVAALEYDQVGVGHRPRLLPLRQLDALL